MKLHLRTASLRSMAAFSLVELLVVVAIVATLATIGLPLMEIAQQRTREEDLRRSLREIRDALDAYKRMSDDGRIAKPADASGYPPNLDVLVEGVTDARSPQGHKLFFLRQMPRDPFSTAPTSSKASSTWALRSYQSTAEEPHPGKDVYDVRSMSAGLALDGTAYRSW